MDGRAKVTEPDDTRNSARTKLDDAIREYAEALRGDRDVVGVGGWNVIIHIVTNNDNTDSYLAESAIGQPWHASIGLIRYAQTVYERPGDEG